MKLKEGMEIINKGWVKRRKGYRIFFERLDKGEWITDLFPGENEKPLTSDISAWELARRFAETTRSDETKKNQGNITNISVVDDLGHTINFYGTNQPWILNPR